MNPGVCCATIRNPSVLQLDHYRAFDVGAGLNPFSIVIPLMDFGMAVGKTESAGVIVVNSQEYRRIDRWRSLMLDFRRATRR